MTSIKAGNFGNIRRSKYVSVLYWTLFYTYTFLIATNWFIYEAPFVSESFTLALLYSHIALLGSIIVGFFFLRKKNLDVPKRVLNVLVVLLILFGAIFAEVRTHLAYIIVLAVLLGQLADCSLLTYIYEMNNAERLFGIVGCHLLVAVVAVVDCFYTRETAVFYWIMFALALAAATCCFLEKKSDEPFAIVSEPFHKKLYVPLILACFGAFFSVCSGMSIIAAVTVSLPDARFFYYGGAVLGAVAYYLLYRFADKPATLTLTAGFASSSLCIALFLAAKSAAFYYVSAVFGGAAFNFCMMNLYYILCTIIKKYSSSNMLKVAPITMNFVGILTAIAYWAVCRYLSPDALYIILVVCLAGNLVILATCALWEKGLSLTARQEEYVRLDTIVTRAQAYEIVGLTEKEKEVAECLLEGLSLKEIAAKLFVSENTVKTHRSNVYRKMEVSSREELVKKLSQMV